MSEKFRELEFSPSRTYVVGDIHGCNLELQSMLTFLEGTQKIGAEDLVVFIGDYIDRGPDSNGVVASLISFQKRHPQTIFLRGNHEDMFLEFLGFEGTEGMAYLKNGGAQCLQSYGLSGEATSEEALASMPRDHLSFLLNTERYVIADKYIYVHAGLDPLRDLRTQLDSSLFWIRDEFITNIHKFEKTVVFGHTPYRDVLFHLPYKIGIDTGLVYGNKLTCLELTGETVLQVKKGSSEILVATFAQKLAKL